jgi:hypothetical protein
VKALALVVVFAAGLARADQCEVVTPAAADAAVKLLKKGVKFVEFCEPCGDKQPGEPQTVDTVEVKPWQDPPDQTVLVNGKEQDLAYVFIHKALGDSHYLNLAVLAKCPAQDVSREIDVEKLRRAPAPKPVQVPTPVGYGHP